MMVCTRMTPICTHQQPTLYIKKWFLSLYGTNLTCTNCNHLYKSLYGQQTLDYWLKNDNFPKKPSQIVWKESRLAINCSVIGIRRTDIKLFCNQCGLSKTLHNWWHQDTHNFRVCNAPHEDIDHLLMCTDPLATEVFKSRVADMKKI